jgi:spore germination cell wall hydrolase CwlJ-like protein
MSSDTSVIYQTTEIDEVTIYAERNKSVELLARLLQSEAGNQPDIGVYAVGTVVLNRMIYRNMTLEEVIFEKNQFCGTKTKYFKQVPNSRLYDIAHKILYENVRVLSPWIMYFANPKIAKNKSWIRRIEKHREIRIYDHVFYADKRAKAFYTNLYAPPALSSR